MATIDYVTYFNDIVNRFYEDENLVKEFGKEFGFNVDRDYFLAVAFLFPLAGSAPFEDKQRLKETLAGIKSVPEINRNIHENQYFYTGRGVATFLIAHSKETILNILPEYEKEAVAILEGLQLKEKVRVGIGLPETGLQGIEDTFQFAKDAVRAGEIFKKERTVLEYMGMEIYSSINAMVTNYGEKITSIVFKQLTPEEIRVLTKYYKCKESPGQTAQELGMEESQVVSCLEHVKVSTGLDVKDTEDNFKLHLLMIAKKVLDSNKKAKKEGGKK
jgi:hypothetical protein